MNFIHFLAQKIGKYETTFRTSLSKTKNQLQVQEVLEFKFIHKNSFKCFSFAIVQAYWSLNDFTG